MATPLNILVVEDHDLLRHIMVGMLREHGHNAEGVFCAEDVANVQQPPHVYVVDLNLPGEDGISLTRRLRQCYPKAGIVIVSARTDLVDRLTGYRTGADVYLSKPFESEELLAVIESMRLRTQVELQAQHGLLLNVARLSLTGPSSEVWLTQSEVSLLVEFLQAKDMVLNHDEVAVHLNLKMDVDSRATLNVRLSHLRKKLQLAGAEEPTIRAIRGHGYKLCAQMNLA